MCFWKIEMRNIYQIRYYRILEFLDTDAEELLAGGFVGDGGVGGGGNADEVGALEIVLLGGWGFGHLGIAPGAGEQVGGELYVIGDAVIGGDFVAKEGDAEGAGGGVEGGECGWAVGDIGVSVEGVFEEVGEAVFVGVGVEFLVIGRKSGKVGGSPGVEWIGGGRIGDDDSTNNLFCFVEGQVHHVVSHGVGACFRGIDISLDL